MNSTYIYIHRCNIIYRNLIIYYDNLGVCLKHALDPIIYDTLILHTFDSMAIKWCRLINGITCQAKNDIFMQNALIINAPFSTISTFQKSIKILKTIGYVEY